MTTILNILYFLICFNIAFGVVFLALKYYQNKGGKK